MILVEKKLSISKTQNMLMLVIEIFVCLIYEWQDKFINWKYMFLRHIHLSYRELVLDTKLLHEQETWGGAGIQMSKSSNASVSLNQSKKKYKNKNY